VAALGAPRPRRVDGWIVIGAFGVQAVFTSWPAHLFLALASRARPPRPEVQPCCDRPDQRPFENQSL
jgi:hypothetical protein